MSRRPVLVVEDQAHLQYGHYPRGCADLARALFALGCDVRMLTSRGWLGDDGAPGKFRVEQFGWATASLWSAAHALAPSSERTQWTRSARWAAYVAATLRAAAIALATRKARGGHRRRASEAPPDVILYHHDVHTFVLAALVGPGRFVHHAFRAPPGDRPHTIAGRAVDSWARRCEAERRRIGGGFRVAAATPTLVDAWTRRAPYLEPVMIGHAMARSARLVDGARGELGIPREARVALMFGADHGNKDLVTVWRAFLDLPDWTLLVVGHVADAYQAWAAQHDAPRAVVVGGYADGPTRACAFSAADVVILSFERGHVRDSGVLLDALAFRRAVVCSDGTDAAAKVAEYGLGAVFEPGDPSALARALDAVPCVVSDDAFERAMSSTSDTAVARAHLEALDQVGRK